MWSSLWHQVGSPAPNHRTPVEALSLVGACIGLIPANCPVEFADAVGAEFRDSMFQAVLPVFARAKRTLDEKVRALGEGPGVFGEFAECDDAVPLGAALPFALIVLPRFLGSHREGGHGRAVLRVVQFGVLAGETDDGELIHVHSFDLLRIDLSPLLSWGTSEQAAPLPSQRSALSGGPAAPNGFLRQGWGNRESRTECSA